MTYLDIFILLSFSTLLLTLKFFYDKYVNVNSLFEILVSELEQSAIQNDSLHESKIVLESKLSQIEEKNQYQINALKAEISTLKSNYQEQKALHEIKITEAISEARKDAVAKSRSVLRGQASEHSAPYVIEGTNPKDYRFMGNPIDYICFDGLSDVLDGVSDTIKAVRLIDIKTGKSSLNKSQRRIRDAINSNKIKFEIINLDKLLNTNSDEK